MDALDQLIARDEIRRLAERYALAVDAKDLDGVASLFVEDVDNGRYGRGRAATRRFYDQSLRRFHCSMHLVANHVIDFDDVDHAHGVVYCRAHHHITEPDHWFDEALAYWDAYERVEGEWLFRRRRVRSWYRQLVDHPDHGWTRTEAAVETTGPKRGGRMPDAFDTFAPFWESDPVAPPGDPT